MVAHQLKNSKKLKSKKVKKKAGAGLATKRKCEVVQEVNAKRSLPNGKRMKEDPHICMWIEW
jgi:hypothetical protein